MTSTTKDITQMARALKDGRDLLTQHVNDVNELLQTLQCGVECWVTVGQQTGSQYELGHAKINNKWGLAIRSGSTLWAYNESPTRLRVGASTHLQDLLNALYIDIEKLAKEVAEAAVLVGTIATAMQEAFEHG